MVEYEFRRGLLSSEINNISFNYNSSLLCVSNKKGTIHLYRLNKNNQDAYYFKSFGMSSLDYSETAIYPIDMGMDFKCGFADKSNDLIVISYNGICKKFTLNNANDDEPGKLPETLNYKLIETIEV